MTPRFSSSFPRRAPLVLCLATAWLLPAPWTAPADGAAARAASQPAASPEETLARARERIEAGDSAEALRLVDRVLAGQPANASALLLRSEARFIEGDLAAGRRDLAEALRLDPSQRQGWLNLAALLISEQTYPAALDAMRKARDLDPAAPENNLNIGAVELLAGQLPEASRSFTAYLAANPASADASYLVATNYAMAGYAALAVQHLTRAIDLDERTRVRVRTDPNFGELVDTPALADLLGRDRYVPPPGAYTASRLFDVAYAGTGGPLVQAVLDALQRAGEPFDPRVEVTPRWALVWGVIRIKISNDDAGQGRVELSAPPTAMSPETWQLRSDKLLRGIAAALVVRGGLGSR